MKKIIAVLGLSLAALTGCGEEENVLVVGTNASFPPFEYIGGESGSEIMGFDIDIVKKVAEDSGKTLKVEDMAFDSLIVALNAGRIDMIAAGMTITPERLANVDFSDPYYEATQVVVTRQGDTSIQSIDDLKGKKISVQLGTTGDIMAKEFSDQVVAFNTGFEAMMELQNGRVDLMLFDKAPAANLLKKNQELVLQELPFNPEYYGLAMAKGNAELLKQVNTTLASMKANGDYDALLTKHIK
ncbi:basic amino acid ABC transporter substrate-binding protein [Enterovibrio sp. ZSDZ35]|uniref:Basic amino acid ABC transporter substrate-binding protein n=1 Tax=Enterovibrio qingdaonensis TaxID=2899818 RepID=A0ABT5QMY2_9GAMM|nr:basic amino acid ABC transporter substrate-binding protein [Enterovibrio sp. ZSDZ35]MDD1781845.1 basic amino acid ABC transporter substrate-binding protein [Enterovibrio sp. ZSDZ35]